MPSRFKDALLCITVQGWVRAAGPVYMSSAVRMRLQYSPQESHTFGVRPVDLFNRAALIPLLTSAGLAVETLGSEGCRVFQHVSRYSLSR